MPNLRSSVMGLALASSLVALPASVKAGSSSKDVPFNWTGFYVGANAGYAWGNSDVDASTGCPATAPPGWICTSSISNSTVNAAAVIALGSGALNPNGFTGGIQAGYNLQSGNFVVGTELDFGALDLNDSRSGSGSLPYLPATFGLTTVSNSIATDWLFTARARLGWAVSNVLFYSTGGLAVSEVTTSLHYRDSFAANPGVMDSADSSVKTGWTVGGGIEWALDRNWTLKGEYLYVDLGSVSTGGVITGSIFPAAGSHPLSSTTDLTAHLARAGLNYKF